MNLASKDIIGILMKLFVNSALEVVILVEIMIFVLPAHKDYILYKLIFHVFFLALMVKDHLLKLNSFLLEILF